MTDQQKVKPKIVTMGEAVKIIGLSRPKLERLVREYGIQLRVNPRDKRQRLLDLNAVKRVLGE
jgi:predicted HTH domain antitoxin